MKGKTVHEVAALTGVTVRTLHHYDQIGLLHPKELTAAGYRLYDEESLARLQQILFFRELDLPLAEIRELLDDERFDAQATLQKHRRLLAMKRDRLDGLIRLTDEILKGEKIMSFKEFDQTEIAKARAEYAAEAKERWGDTAAYAENERRTRDYDGEKWQQTEEESARIFRAFAAEMDKAPDDPAVQALVVQWRDYISANFYECTDEILAGLGEMYTADPRFQKNIDQHAAGLAAFIAKAIAAHCAG